MSPFQGLLLRFFNLWVACEEHFPRQWYHCPRSPRRLPIRAGGICGAEPGCLSRRLHVLQRTFHYRHLLYHADRPLDSQTLTNRTTAFYKSPAFVAKAQENDAFLKALPPFLDGRAVTLENMVRTSYPAKLTSADECYFAFSGTSV